MEHGKTECEAPPEHPVLCVNNCGFFGTAATMNMCSKCHKDMLLKQDQQAKLVSALMASSYTEVMQAKLTEPVKIVSVKPLSDNASGSEEKLEEEPTKEGPHRCSHCKKRIGFTGFKCRCYDFFCGSHRYSDKHDCPFAYLATAQDAIVRANPVVKAEKVDKI